MGSGAAMTTGRKLSAESSLSGVTAMMHLKNIRHTTIIACESYVEEEEVTLLPKDDIISLENEPVAVLVTVKKSETQMESLYGIQKDC